jgi:acetamidase/formamidase
VRYFAGQSKFHMRNTLILSLILSTLTAFGQPKTIEFKPKAYYRKFSHKTPPALRISPGDTLVSETVDAGGFDKTGKSVAESGNPQTGPFYVEGAMPGDVLAITLTRVFLNRDYALTVEQFVKRSLPFKVAKPIFGWNAKQVKWTLDREEGYAFPQITHEHLGNFKVPLKPFMGCLAVAAPSKDKEPLTYFAGQFGGNMDFYKVAQGATIYLPVFHEGALLYIGDGHALQGDGEITGDALETSMDFSLVTKVIKSSELQLKFPRMEDSEHIMAMATAKTLEEALKLATLGLLEWVQKDYSLSLNEASQVLGPLMEYRIPTLAGPKVEIVAMVKRESLKGLTK